jgi:hypothetical protein
LFDVNNTSVLVPLHEEGIVGFLVSLVGCAVDYGVGHLVGHASIDKVLHHGLPLLNSVEDSSSGKCKSSNAKKNEETSKNRGGNNASKLRVVKTVTGASVTTEDLEAIGSISGVGGFVGVEGGAAKVGGEPTAKHFGALVTTGVGGFGGGTRATNFVGNKDTLVCPTRDRLALPGGTVFRGGGWAWVVGVTGSAVCDGFSSLAGSCFGVTDEVAAGVGVGDSGTTGIIVAGHASFILEGVAASV